MKQILALGFYSNVYRKEPLCRIYKNEQFLDEFTIPHTPTGKNLGNNDTSLDPNYINAQHTEYQNNSCYWKIIEFDDRGQDFLEFKIELKLDDNNYSNGFMTKCSLAMFSQCYLASENVCKKIDRLEKKWKFTRSYLIKNHDPVDTLKKLSDPMRNLVFQNLALHSVISFPGIEQLDISEKMMHRCTRGKLPKMYRDYPPTHWIGSSGYFHLTLKKKFGFWRCATDGRFGRWKLGHSYIVKDLYDKYTKKNEN